MRDSIDGVLVIIDSDEGSKRLFVQDFSVNCNNCINCIKCTREECASIVQTNINEEIVNV